MSATCDVCLREKWSEDRYPKEDECDREVAHIGDYRHPAAAARDCYRIGYGRVLTAATLFLAAADAAANINPGWTALRQLRSSVCPTESPSRPPEVMSGRLGGEGEK